MDLKKGYAAPIRDSPVQRTYIQFPVSSEGATVIQTAYKPDATALSSEHINELKTIWKLNQRVPSLASRRAWAAARKIYPFLVHRWFASRKSYARQRDQTFSNETYELSVAAPVLPFTPSFDSPSSSSELRSSSPMMSIYDDGCLDSDDTLCVPASTLKNSTASGDLVDSLSCSLQISPPRSNKGNFVSTVGSDCRASPWQPSSIIKSCGTGNPLCLCYLCQESLGRHFPHSVTLYFVFR